MLKIQWVVLTAVFLLTGCQAKQPEVVVYTSVDQVYSEPFFKQFEADTGIKVRANYDVEASKTTGLVTRLIAEKDNPIADVFWNGEFSQTIKLKEEGVLKSYKSANASAIDPKYVDRDGYWTAFGGRARVLIVNTDHMNPDDYPSSIYDFLSDRYKDYPKAMAKPLFGTSATQAAALFAHLGKKETKAFYEGLEKSNVRIVDGNSVVRDLVANGELAFGLTDTDDALGALENGKPIKVIFPDQGVDQIGTLIVPNTVALIKGSQNEVEAQQFIDYLLSAESEDSLIEMGWCQLGIHESGYENPYFDIHAVKSLNISLESIYAELDDAQLYLKEVFMK